MSKIEPLADVPNVAPLNGNNDKIETAFQNTLSRDGSTPNQMEANLDMNNNRILNLPDAVHNQEPITLAQAAGIASVDTVLSRENVGAVLYPRTDAETAATVTPTNYYYPPGNVKRYGAAGDGATNDSTAVQNAINAHPEHVYFPLGNYLLTTGLEIGDSTYVEMEQGSKLLANTNSMIVLKTATGFRTGIKLVNVTIDGNGKTGVTALKLSNCQYDVVVTNPNINDSTYGIIIDTTSIGVHVENPTIYGTTNPIQINASNACVVTCPAIDNQTGDAALTGTGIFISGSSNLIQGGFIQGFQYGFYDQGDYNTVDNVYFELCTDCAVFWDGCLVPCIQGVFFFGYNATPSAAYLLVATNTKGGVILYPRMVTDNSTGGLFYAVNGNSECYALWTTDGSTTNTDLGTPTQIQKIGKQTTNSYTGTLTGCTTSPTGTLYYTSGDNCVTLYIPALSATSNTTACTITGMPDAIKPARAQVVLCRITDNGTTALGCVTIGTDGVMTFYVGAAAAAFTNSGTKGVPSQTLTYSMD